MVFDKMQHNATIQREDDPPNLAFKGIARAQFYFLDRFILVASLHQLLLYKYAIDDTVDDVRRYLANSRYRLVCAVTQPDPHAITAFAAVNSFLSHIVLCAGSDRFDTHTLFC